MTFTDRLNLAMKERNFTQAQLGNAIGVAQSAIWKLTSGTSKTSRKVVEIAHALNVNPEWLATGKGDSFLNINIPLENNKNINADSVKIDVLDVEASCGNGVIINKEFEKVLRSIEFTQEYAVKLFGTRNAEYIKVITAKGDSMCPTIKSGANVFVDTKKNYFEGDGVYVFVFDNEIYIKRIQITGTEIIVISDNTVYEKWRLPKNTIDQFYIQGKVFVGQNIDYVYFD